MPYVWAVSHGNYDWYAYKPTPADYAAVAKEINSYLEMFLEQQRTPNKEKAANLYLLYWHGEWGAKSNAELKVITSDKETLYAAIGGEILTGNMVYLGESGGKGFEDYKKDYLAGRDVLKELDYGFVKEMDEALLAVPSTVSDYYTDARDFLAADFAFDPEAFDEAYNSEDAERGDDEQDEEYDDEI